MNTLYHFLYCTPGNFEKVKFWQIANICWQLASLNLANLWPFVPFPPKMTTCTVYPLLPAVLNILYYQLHSTFSISSFLLFLSSISLPPYIVVPYNISDDTLEYVAGLHFKNRLPVSHTPLSS